MEIRLQKYLAECGVASRRKSEELITLGKVTVNGEVVKTLGAKVNPDSDIVKVDNKAVSIEARKLYIMLNKPEGYITSLKDERDRKVVVDLIDVRERIFPIGRLDYNTSGLLLLTNDGDVYNKIMHPRNEIVKTYIATVRGIFTEKEMASFRKGVDIGDYITAPSEIKTISISGGNSTVEIKIHEGRNRQVRRMCERFNHKVITLKRISLGNLQINDLPKGQWRLLTDEEIRYLKDL